MSVDLSLGPAAVADQLTLLMRPRHMGRTAERAIQRAQESGLHPDIELAALRREHAELRQRERRARFIAAQRLSASEAVHIPLNFDPAPEAGA